jgi:hypothetical protein
MLATGRWRRGAAGVLAVAIALATGAVAAQSPNADTSDGLAGASPMHHQHRHGQSNGQPRHAALPEVPVTPAPWPRLDPGAVLCRTAEDLRQHFAILAARLNGNNAAAEAPGCRVIQAQTAVVVLAREGLGRTRVRISSAPAETGWTDVYLPDKGGKP